MPRYLHLPPCLFHDVQPMDALRYPSHYTDVYFTVLLLVACLRYACGLESQKVFTFLLQGLALTGTVVLRLRLRLCFLDFVAS